MTHAEAQIWLGIRALDQVHERLIVPRDQAEDALRLLRQSSFETPREEQLQRELEGWLVGHVERPVVASEPGTTDRA